MASPKTWTYSIKAISDAAAIPIRNLYFHIDTGDLVPSDLRDVALFISRYYYRKLRETWEMEMDRKTLFDKSVTPKEPAWAGEADSSPEPT